MCLNTGQVPTLMTEGLTVLIVKDKSEATVVENYIAIACLQLMCNVLEIIFSEAVYGRLRSPGNYYQMKRRYVERTPDQLLINKAILKNCRRRLTYIYMEWIEYRKAYDRVPWSCILESTRMVGVAQNIVTLIENSMENRKTVLT